MVRCIFRKRRLLKPPRIKSKTGCPEVDLLTEFHCSSIILHTVGDILRQLEIKRENFSLFLTNGARCMSSAGKTLKELYPSLMHVT